MAARPKTTDYVLPLADMAVQIRDQWLASVKQTQELAFGAAKTAVELAKSVPMPELSKFLPASALPAVPPVGNAVNFAFETVTETIAAQRAFVLQLSELLQPTVAA